MIRIVSGIVSTKIPDPWTAKQIKTENTGFRGNSRSDSNNADGLPIAELPFLATELPHISNDTIELRTSPCSNREQFTGVGMSKIQSHRRQEHSIDTGLLEYPTILLVIPVPVITDDRARCMMQMSSDLVRPTR